MTGQTLDPFGYWPAKRSRIRPLGGPDKSDDADYVFHTSYVALPPGAAVAEISFDELTAETGMIAIRIFQHLASGNPAVTEQGKMTALLPSVAKTQRSIKVAFEALPGATYAVTGYVFAECDARAKALNVAIRPRHTEADDPLRARSMFGRLKARFASGLSAADAPTLQWPVSQGYTVAQTREADFARLTSDLPVALPAAERWEAAYIVRVLEQYGRLEPGARGLALAAASDPAAPYVTRSGCDLGSVILARADTIAGACARHLPNAEEARGFDFVWSRSGVFGEVGSTRTVGLIEELLDRLRPGGLGIHMVTTGGDIDRHALNRIALGVAALGHVVAQLRYPAADAGPAPFGIVFRKTTEEIMA
jgi:hypothetical protein